MSISSELFNICPLCICVCVNVISVAVGAPFMSPGTKQSLLKTTNLTTVSSSGGFELFEDTLGNSTTDGSTGNEVVDMWSVMWYLGAFGGLVTFFLIVTCSEWCFGNHMYTRHGINELYVNAYQSNFHESQRRVPETPPPPYDLFAPPSYSDLFGKVQEAKKKSSRISVFIIPIHRRQSSAAAS